MRPLEAFLLVCPQETTQFLVRSGILLLIMRGCAASTPQLSRMLSDYEESDIAVISYLSVVARMILLNAQLMVEAATAVLSALRAEGALQPAGEGSGDPQVLMKEITRLLIDKFDSVGYCSAGMWRRRLWCVSLLSLYPTQDNDLLQSFPEVINIAADVVSEENTQEAKGRAARMVDTMVSVDEDMGAWADCDDNENDGLEGDAEDGSAGTHREPIAEWLGRFLKNDITSLSVYSITRERLNQISSALGAEMFRQLTHFAGESTIQMFMS
jgi:hypothetical protein